MSICKLLEAMPKFSQIKVFFKKPILKNIVVVIHPKLESSGVTTARKNRQKQTDSIRFSEAFVRICELL
jgi:hypothetical protein